MMLSIAPLDLFLKLSSKIASIIGKRINKSIVENQKNFLVGFIFEKIIKRIPKINVIVATIKPIIGPLGLNTKCKDKEVKLNKTVERINKGMINHHFFIPFLRKNNFKNSSAKRESYIMREVY